MENLRALVQGRKMSLYQRSLAVQEFDKLQREIFLNMQYYMEYCEKNKYVTPQDWVKKHKHF